MIGRGNDTRKTVAGDSRKNIKFYYMLGRRNQRKPNGRVWLLFNT